MNLPKPLPGLVLSSLLACAANAQVAVVDGFQWKRSGDSIRMEFRFADGVRPRYRIRSCGLEESPPCLRVEIASGRLAPEALGGRPSWLTVPQQGDSGVLDFRIALREPTPWKFAWTGNRLDVDILDRVQREGVARNPWMYGGVGAGVVAGGLLFWFFTAGSEPTSAPSVIPPPDVELPRR
ncbi:MAG TPA: hypothetical protein PK208_16820 [Fibrobacteria bacterium]|nr:hypothetical protein [Fibrobacteria bacterium]